MMSKQLQHISRVSTLVTSKNGSRALRTRTFPLVASEFCTAAVHAGAPWGPSSGHIADIWQTQRIRRIQWLTQPMHRMQPMHRLQEGHGRKARSFLAAVHASSGDDLLTDIDKLSELAQIKLTEEEKREIGPQIERIVDWMGQLNDVDVDGVRPSMRGGDEGDEGAEGHVDTAWLRPDVEADDPKDVEGRGGVLERTNEEGFVAVPPAVFR